MSADNFLDVKIMGREYRVACAPDGQANLLKVVEFVDSKMTEIAAKTRNTIPERIAVMAAMNIANELLSGASADNQTASPETASAQLIATHELNDTHRRLSTLSARIDHVLKESE